MNIYNPIMKAADHIEANPALFDFQSTEIPRCGTPGCALGWIGHFMGRPAELSKDEYFSYSAVAIYTLKLGPWIVADRNFYKLLDDLTNRSRWRDNAIECAKALRLFAASYYGEKPAITGIPDSVRQIFAELPGERVS